jgi:hypothetical protein
MLVKKPLDKQLRDQAKEKSETGYLDSQRFIIQKPLLKKEAYYTPYSTTYLGSTVELSISRIERKVYRKIQRQRKLKDNQFLYALKKSYNMPNSSDVAIFLDRHLNLVDFLLESAKQIRIYFPSEELSLEVVSDPETAGNEELFVYILTSLPAKDALEKLNEFDDQWFLDQLDLTDGLFNFNLRFV